MPEMPEVETVVRSLNRLVKGLVIKNVTFYYPKIIKSDITKDAFEKTLINRKIDNISRIAKHIIFELGDMALISHLRMEGKWFYEEKNAAIDMKHVLVLFELDNDMILYYHDTRRFGTFHWQPIDEYKIMQPILKVGPEANSEIVTGKFLKDLMGKSNKHVKTVLLDQTKISGIGNIYADEICYDARIRPEKVAQSITLDEYEQISISCKKILDKAIQMGGTTIDTYQPEKGVDGKFQNELKVHTKKGMPCVSCGEIIIKIKLNGRGTYLCTSCQKW